MIIKSVKLTLLFTIIVLLCSGCARKILLKDDSSFPDLTIQVRENYNYNPMNYYDEIETENGYDVVVHLVKEK